MIDGLSQQFLETGSEKVAVNLIRSARCNNDFNLGIKLGEFFIKLFPHSLDIKDEYSINSYYLKNYKKAFEISKNILDMTNLSEQMSKHVIFNQHFGIKHVCDLYTYYDKEKIDSITNRKKPEYSFVTFSVTTCKRFDLFEKTINSFINCCLDLDRIDEWICVDDNSSEDDRKKMQEMYPFFTFYFKTIDEKGHPKSMNIIRNMVKSPYLFHMEDDWKFFEQRKFISECLEILGTNDMLGQCLVNKNYAEVMDDHDILGGEFKVTMNGLRYYLHEWVRTDEEKKTWTEKHGNGRTCNYWPHYSFRPSLLRTKIFKDLGEFNENVSHFEMEYAYRYVNKEYTSAFLENIYSLHIGRLTSERNDPTKANAYTLNNELQLSGKEEMLQNKKLFNFKFETFVVNLDRRLDRWENFEKKATELKFLQYKRFSAVDGNKLKPNPQLQRIFDNNDYNMRKGMVGCAMSHIKLYIDLIKSDNDAYLILEDDLDFVPDFKNKLVHLCKQAKDWDLLYLGHHCRDNFMEGEYDKEKMPTSERRNAYTSLVKSLGGTGGYFITKKGAIELLDFINITGMTNGIDTVQQRSANHLNVQYASPHLIYSECVRGDNNPDTDIQRNFDSLTMSVEDRLKQELEFYDSITEVFELPKTEPSESVYYKGENLGMASLNYNYAYDIDGKILFIVPSGKPERYFHRFKKSNNWSISDALTEI